jgi:hypothetical protein
MLDSRGLLDLDGTVLMEETSVPGSGGHCAASGKGSEDLLTNNSYYCGEGDC